MSYPVTLKHKCGFIIKKRDMTKATSFLGCPQCEKAKSKGEKEIAGLLLKWNIPFMTEFSFKDLRGEMYPLRFDFALTNKLMLIEYDGEGHYNPDSKYYQNNNNDERKNQYCSEHNIPLLRIPYWDYKKIPQLILNFL